jgi:hypothetical protein
MLGGVSGWVHKAKGVCARVAKTCSAVSPNSPSLVQPLRSKWVKPGQHLATSETPPSVTEAHAFSDRKRRLQQPAAKVRKLWSSTDGGGGGGVGRVA